MSIHTLHVSLPAGGYDVLVGRGLLSELRTHLRLDRRVLVLTDKGVPPAYAQAVADAAKEPLLLTVKEGEGSKSFAVFEDICRQMLAHGFGRGDCVVAVGGGVVGDLGGMIAAAYMRGVDFYNIPTTLLAQVDSSIGGKVAVNLDGVKNAVGFFYQPTRVLVDPDVLSTLPARLMAAGMAEAVKMALSFDADLFALFERGEGYERIDEVICRSLAIKRDVVEQDERESGLRRVLNLGHTLGHGIESAVGIDADKHDEGGLYHGECVALGMLPMCSEGVRARLSSVLSSLGLPTVHHADRAKILAAVSHDKKAAKGGITAVLCESVGSYTLIKMTPEEFLARYDAVLGG